MLNKKNRCRLIVASLGKLIFIFFLSLSFFACKRSVGEAKPIPTPYTISVPRYFPTKLNIPTDNPLTVEGIALGRYLFYDGRMSGRTHADSLMSCYTCHVQEYAFEAGLDNPRAKDGKMLGLLGVLTPHAMLPLFNQVFNHKGYLWNGYVQEKNLEALTAMMIEAPHECGGNVDATVNLIKSIPMYPPLFEAAFGSTEINIELISKAIAQFVRTFVSADSKFDKYLRGEVALSEEEMKGYILFTTEEGADCFHCHGGSGNLLFTTNDYLNNGLDAQIEGVLGDRFSVTKNANDKGAFKVPTLRNISYTAPYMHDGRFTSLEQVLDFYSEQVQWNATISPLMHHVMQGGVQLTENEKMQVLAFLKTLNDESFIRNEKFSKPAWP